MKFKVTKWLVDRFATAPIRSKVFIRRTAKGSWYFGDGATLTLLLGVLVVTGAAMSMTYSPEMDSAHDSVVYLTHHQILGWFVRGLHYWSAGLMVVMLFFHLFRQILLGGYKAPREGTWLVGVMLFFAIIFMSFSGYLLRWDERSISALKVAMHMFYHIPFIGEWLVVFIQGGREIGSLTLTRIFSLHVIIVPMIIITLVSYHVYLVIYHGTTSPTEREEDVETAAEQREVYEEDAESHDRGERFYPETMASSGMMAFAFVTLAIILTLTLGPAEILPKASLDSYAKPMEEWWFYWYSGLIAQLPSAMAPGFIVIFPAVVFFALVLLPFVDRGPKRGAKRRPVAAAFVISCVVAMVVLTSLRMQSPWTAWPSNDVPPLPPGVILSEEAELGRTLFPRYGCNTCHSVGGHGNRVAVDLASLTRIMSHAELVAYIRQPPQGVAMPAYDNIPAEDLHSLAAYVLASQTFPRDF